MLGKIGELSRYSVDDAEKIRLMDEAMTKGEMFAKLSQKLFKPDYKKSAEDIKFEDFAIDYDVDDDLNLYLTSSGEDRPHVSDRILLNGKEGLCAYRYAAEAFCRAGTSENRTF